MFSNSDLVREAVVEMRNKEVAATTTLLNNGEQVLNSSTLHVFPLFNPACLRCVSCLLYSNCMQSNAPGGDQLATPEGGGLEARDPFPWH